MAKRRATANASSDDPTNPTDEGPPTRTVRKRSTTKSDASENAESDPPKKKRATKASSKKANEKVEASPPDNEAETSKPPAKKKAPGHQVLTERDDLPKLWDPIQAATNGSYAFRIASWNVAGLRAVLTKAPDTFRQLVDRYDLDILCLQETKLQEQHITDPKLKIRETMCLMDDFDDYWSCSTAKKGYSGTAVFVRRRDKGQTKATKQTTLDHFRTVGSKTDGETKAKTKSPLAIDSSLLVPETVGYTMGKEQHDAEGRIVVVDYPLFSLCNVYVPNAGQKLERLTYRTDEWDKDFLAFLQAKQSTRSRPIIWLGDLNVAHTHLEVWNDGAKHLPKQAGVTPEERASFTAQLAAGDFRDAFRALHPTAAGHYSYWSTRAGNRGPNKGLRLDYFVCDPALWDEQASVVVRDSYMAFEQEGSDHCPVILELEIKSHAS